MKLRRLKPITPTLMPIMSGQTIGIDAKAFLQHVAYGQQAEAGQLLLKDPLVAQELLKAENIPFTDYSGRTFTCTAYEYAYWAKDAHMLRMLEKYIKVDEETRAFILKRVKHIEELVNSPEVPGFFEPQKHPRGLHYTTKDKEGNITDHNEAHFDLGPLKKALNHYVTAYGNNPKQSDEDWAQLDKIWIEEVGRSQRAVPAHIAQEYCHPDRSFDDVTKDKSYSLLDASNPANLNREFKFYNTNTNKHDLWFTSESYLMDSGLGFSFGMLRGEGGCGVGCGWPAGACCGRYDLDAVMAIDKVRTRDVKQSLESLRSQVQCCNHSSPIFSQ